MKHQSDTDWALTQVSFEFTPTEMFKSCLRGDGRKSILHRNMEPRKGGEQRDLTRE